MIANQSLRTAILPPIRPNENARYVNYKQFDRIVKIRKKKLALLKKLKLSPNFLFGKPRTQASFIPKCQSRVNVARQRQRNKGGQFRKQTS